MPNISDHSNNQRDDKSTSSGHGALGMGGQPVDNPRGQASGGGDDITEETYGAGAPVAGAFGRKSRDLSVGSVAGVPGDKDALERLKVKPKESGA